jgi:hypothetical protein
MTKRKRQAVPFSGDQRISIRMSKVSRMLQSTAAKTNWEQMVKLLFRTDPDGGRKEEIGKLLPLSRPGRASYGSDQLQYMLFLMLVISIAEQRTQESYGKDFAERCDQISKQHELKDDEYWKDGQVPPEWEELNHEFEQNSLSILIQTLKEYNQNDIASLVEKGGLEQLFEILKSIKSQFLRVLKNAEPGTSDRFGHSGSIPEALQSSLQSRKSSSK